MNYPKRKAWLTISEKGIGKFHTSDNFPLHLFISSSAWILFASTHHDMVTECDYFVVLEVFCLFPCMWVCERVILLSLYFISVYSPSLFAVFCQTYAGAAVSTLFRPSAVFLARLCWYCWFHRASSSPLIVGSLVPGSVPALRGVWAAWHGESRQSTARK